MTETARSNVSGILWMLLAGLVFVGMNAIVRHLGTALPAPQSAFLRFLFGLIFLCPALVPILRTGFSMPIWKLFGLRGALHAIGVMLWFYAMARLPLAEVTALGYLNPIVVTVGAALFLGERLAMRRIIAILVALVGAVIVLRPGFRELGNGQIAQLCAAVSFGLSYLVAKRLSALVSPVAVVAMMSLTVTIALLPFAVAVWVPPTLVQTAWLALTAAFATAGHYAMTRAFAAAPLTVTQPVTFLQLVWATLLGTFAFGDPLDPFILLGGAIIIAAISYMTWREARVRRRVITPLPNQTKL
ncbi:DMT family transporter [Paracoccus pacificus]|uniref:DMT family transporter n=1 Tax=Paracoccus pacificus TaxID=1463598 RepID=A0ABW4RAT1_9RHOB